MILKNSPIDQNADNLFKVPDVESPCSAVAEKTIFAYDVTIDITVTTAVNQINITEPGGSATTYTLDTDHSMATAAGRAALIEELNALLESLGYDRGIGGSISGNNFTVVTDPSEIVFNWLEATPAGDFAQVSGSDTVVGFA